MAADDIGALVTVTGIRASVTAADMGPQWSQLV